MKKQTCNLVHSPLGFRLVCLLLNPALLFYSNCYFQLDDNFDEFHPNFALCSIRQKMQCLWGKRTAYLDILQIFSWQICWGDNNKMSNVCQKHRCFKSLQDNIETLNSILEEHLLFEFFPGLRKTALCCFTDLKYHLPPFT